MDASRGRRRDTLRWRAFDTHGVITTADAADLGIPAVALRQLAARGALTRVGYGVYRMAEIPPTPMTEYAEAVALVGAGAVIADEAVLAMHELALVSPARIKVATSRRTRATLPPAIQVVRRTLISDDVTQVEGIPTMTIAAAMRACRGRVMSSRLQDGVRDAARRQLLDDVTAASLLDELCAPSHGQAGVS